MSVNFKLKVGKVSVRTPKYLSEFGYVQAVNNGMRQIVENLKYIVQQFEDVTPDFMYDALQPTFDKSQMYCPVDTGALKESGYLEIVERSGTPQVEMGYGAGGNPPYTVYVHEMVEIPHKPPTQAKFLERAINEDMSELIDRLAAQYKEFMGPA